MLVCECGCRDIEIVHATYPEDADGRPTGTATERYECQACGRTGTYAFGKGVSRTGGCVTTTYDSVEEAL
jgi:transposase-like protein